MGARLGGRSACIARLSRVKRLSDADGHTLAGLLDAEGHFAISPNNGGRNWRCSAHVTLRRDDAPLLAKYRSLTGLGTIVPRPACRNSRPQALWSIGSGLECLRLADLLEAFPLLGRKRSDAIVWITAVRAKEARLADLGQLACELRAARRYAEPEDAALTIDLPEHAWRAYFGGFVTGEGSLHLSPRTARVVTKLRRDDRPLLLGFAARTGLGRVYDVAPCGNAKPASAWSIYRQSDIPGTIDLLATATLHGRKRREFEAWRHGAEEFIAARREGRRRDAKTIARATEALRCTRLYRDVPIRRRDDACDQRAAFTGALRTFARTSGHPLTCTRYTEARRSHPHWPNRNTVVRAFGSWQAALEAAGVAGRPE